jgi:hypothetical protein
MGIFHFNNHKLNCILPPLSMTSLRHFHPVGCVHHIRNWRNQAVGVEKLFLGKFAKKGGGVVCGTQESDRTPPPALAETKVCS